MKIDISVSIYIKKESTQQRYTMESQEWQLWCPSLGCTNQSHTRGMVGQGHFPLYTAVGSQIYQIKI